MIGSVQAKLYPCLSDEPVLSLQTACNEILKNVFTTEQGFEEEEDDFRDDISCCDADSIATNSTRKTSNSVPPSNITAMESTMRKFQDLVAVHDSSSPQQRGMIFTAENAAELQYRCNRRAQRIQRAFERRLKSSEDHARHLHERYGNRGTRGGHGQH
ncbi:MAG: hypothetical protein SGBAC_009451 [Bacillariaceae sp.]